MRYAQVKDGVVVNVIALYASNASDFPEAVALDDVPAGIGDTYDGTYFYRDGVRVLSPLQEAEETIAELDAALLEMQYQNLIGGLDE